MIDLRATADRAEDGIGADVELDCLVAAAIGWAGVTHGGMLVGWRDPDGEPHAAVPSFSSSEDAAISLLPWKPHPSATFSTKTINSGPRGFISWAEFTWPSTEVQGRGTDRTRAILACALRAVARTNEELAPYTKGKRP